MRPIDADALIDELSLVYDIGEAEDDPYNIGVMAAIAKVKQMPTIELRRERDWNGWEDGKGGTYLYDERVLDTQPSIGNIDSTSIVNCGARMERGEDGNGN